MNEKEFDYLGITKWHKKGYTGKGIIIASKEKNTSDHGGKVYDILKQVCPGAEIKCFVDYKKRDDFDVYTTSAFDSTDKNQNERVKALNDKGKILFCAVGNSGKDTTTFTARSGLLAVGAMHLKDDGSVIVASYSSTSDELDFYSFSELNVSCTSKEITGTSFSAPLLAGMITLVQEYFMKKIGRMLTYTEMLEFMHKNSKNGLFILPDIDDDVEIVLKIGDKRALVNNEEVELDTAPIIKDNRTFVPIRFVAENLGCIVNWDEEKREVIIKK